MENKHTRSVSLIDGHTEDRTDAEVMKALECCKQGTAVDCKECPLYEDKGHTCITILSYKSLDLINRQQAQIQKLEKIERLATKTIEKQTAEIEKLNVELVGMRGACESYKMHYDNAQAEIKRLNGISDRLNDICTNQDLEIERLKADSDMADGYEDALVEMTKSEAIKEFAKKLNLILHTTTITIGDYLKVKRCVDDLVKEMTEVKEN